MGVWYTEVVIDCCPAVAPGAIASEQNKIRQFKNGTEQSDVARWHDVGSSHQDQQLRTSTMPSGVTTPSAAAAATLRRSHGFEWPWHPLQVAAWVLFASLAVYFFAFIYPLLWRGDEYVAPISAVFCVSATVALISGYLTARRDPADSALLSKEAAVGFHGPDRVHCYLCEVKVCVEMLLNQISRLLIFTL
jgi:hypothetical protein